MSNTDAWREADEDAIAESQALTRAFKEQASPFAKRQRRPNVRLEDLGDQHASPAADKRKKKTGKPLGAGVYVSSGGLLKQSSLDDEDDAQRADDTLSCCLNGAAESCPPIEKAAKLKQIFKITGKIVQKGVQKPVAPKVAASVKKSSRLSKSINAHCKQKVPRMHDAKDMHFDKENNAHTVTSFEASGHRNFISPFERREQGDMVLLHADQNNQSGEFSVARAQARAEKANQWTQALSRMHAFKRTDDADGKCTAHANGSLHVPKGKLIVKAKKSMHGTRNKYAIEANGNGDGWETSKKNAVRQCLGPSLGVREWLQDLGLGKYAQVFEAHEVGPEVLPLLTLDDLREMGVTAVGSRRKMFYAIQHIRKALLAET